MISPIIEGFLFETIDFWNPSLIDVEDYMGVADTTPAAGLKRYQLVFERLDAPGMAHDTVLASGLGNALDYLAGVFRMMNKPKMGHDSVLAWGLDGEAECNKPEYDDGVVVVEDVAQLIRDIGDTGLAFITRKRFPQYSGRVRLLLADLGVGGGVQTTHEITPVAEIY